ncbi:hypothetical protein Tco_0478139 [Tanacetum coccineum]
MEIDNLKRRVKKLEKKDNKRTYKLKRLCKERKIHDIDVDEDITLDSTHFGVHDVDGDEVFVETEEHVLKALAELKNVKPKTVTTAATTTTTAVTRPKAKGIVIQEQEQAPTSTPIVSSSQSSEVMDKGKGIMVEDPLKMKKKDQDKVETDYKLAQRLQAEEQEELPIKEKSKLFQQLLEKRRKHITAKRAEEKKNKPPTKAQQRSIMCTYLKNMAGWKPKDLKTKSFANVQELFDKAMKRVNTFVDMDTELVEGSEARAKGSQTIAQESSLKRAGDELEQEKAKKQKIDDDQEEAGMKELILYDVLEVTAAKVRVTAAKQNLVLLSNLNENYAKYTARVKLVLLVKNEENILSSYYCLYTVNAAGAKLQLLTKLQLLRIKTEERIKIDWRSRLLMG